MAATASFFWNGRATTRKMDQGTDIYIKDYKALKEKLTRYPGITIVAVDKEPPEQYVIEYRLFGYGYDPSGEIQMLRRHRVEINLPFGYPHFPPTVKPLSRICHPNVAEHAVRIADFWQTNPSLAALVIHLGDMIRGQIYTLEGAFNEEAAKWYAANAGKLPLGELEYIDPHAVAKRPGRSASVSGKIVAAGILVVLVLAGGGQVIRETMILSAGAEALQQVESSLGNRQFKEAEALARETVEDLSGIIFLRSDRGSLQSRVAQILQSDTLREGLAGRVAYKGQFLPINTADTLQEIDRLSDTALARIGAGDVEAAVTIFGAATRLAEKNGLEAKIRQIKQLSAEKRLVHYVDQANARYSEQQWQQAADLYGLAMLIFDNEAGFLSAESLGTREKIDMLRILALASLSRQEAVQAEKQKEYGKAAERYRDIVQRVERSKYANDPVMAKIVTDADAEQQRTAELALVEDGSAYLVENFKTIFMDHYPGLYEPGLQSPRVRYIGRRDGRLVFIISCIELVNRNTNEFRLYYQYNPERRSWSLYRE